MTLNTNFNASPFFDDFDQTKNFYRVLFRPAIAVQARELTQVQSILQDQIQKFGDSIYKDGSIVSGCSITDINPVSFVRLQDLLTTSNTFVDVTGFVGKKIVSATSNLAAKVIMYNTGSQNLYPNTNVLYVQYLNSGSNNESTVANGENLVVYNVPLTGNNTLDIVANVTSYISNSTTQTVGQARGIAVSDGVIYQKGFFVRCDSQIGVVNAFATDAGNTVVGFSLTENIVTPDQDPSLFDNALGYGNANAPGAFRLKLTPKLTFLDAKVAANTNNFNAIATYNVNNLIIKNETDNYSVLGDELARRVNDQAGNFIVNPFTVDTIANANNQLMTARVSPGIGYAQGYRIELLKQAQITVRRGIDTAYSNQQQITTSFGNYVEVNNYVGQFDFDRFQSVDIYDAPQNAIEGRTYLSISPVGTKIGTATLRSVVFAPNQSAIPGTANCKYQFYIFNINMLPNKNFSMARSFVNGLNGYCDTILDTQGKATLVNSNNKSAFWTFGQTALLGLHDASHNLNSEYTLRKKQTSTLQANGVITVNISTSAPGGTDKFSYGVGSLDDTTTPSFVVVALSNAYTNNLAGTVTTSGNTITGSATSFTTDFSVGELILIGSESRIITDIASSTTMSVDVAFGTTHSAATYVKYIPAGSPIPMESTLVGNRNIFINTPTSATINTGYSLSSAVPAAVYFDVLRTNVAPAKKAIKKNRFVKIDITSNPGGVAGPWSLGVADVYNISAIYAGTTFSANNPNILSSFVYESGQKDTHYDFGKLHSLVDLTATPKLLVQLDYFSANTTNGLGFFTVESYPIDDANTANTTAIQTVNFPFYTSEGGFNYNLRDTVDFRPMANNTATDVGFVDLSNTAAVNTAITAATLNPSANVAFSVPSNGSYFPSPDKNFQSDIQYYLGRNDIFYFNNAGILKIKEGVSSVNPQSPAAPVDGMQVSIIQVKPYPSLTGDQVQALTNVNSTSTSLIRDTTTTTKVSIITNRRYTMSDIGLLDKRISNLEYYVSLNLLETSTASLQITDNNGNSRFKNGIFVDGFTDNTLGDVANPEYKIAIDKVLTVARPYFDQENIKLEYKPAKSGNITKTGRCLTLPYDEKLLMTQPYATKYRTAAPVAFKWNGFVTLYPSYDNGIDTINNPAVAVTLDNTSAWQDFANSPFGTNWGSWNTTTSTSTTVTG